ncbi:MAG: SNF2-related protein, partial [Myxococcales bacterium]
MQALFEAIRESCSRATWSRAVEMVRAGAVVGDGTDDEVVTLRVSTAGTAVSRTVTLYLEDEDWSCDCSTHEDVCVHVAAAAIALRRARQSGEDLPKASVSVARVHYLFTRAEGGLLFERAFAFEGGRRETLATTLSAISSGRIKGPAFVASAAEVAVDLLLGLNGRGWLPRELMAKLIGALTDCSDIFLDGAPLKVSSEPVGLVGRLEDQGVGFRLSVVQDQSITEVFSNGCVLCGDTLRPVGESKLSARELQELRPGRYFGPEQVIDLLTEVLPSLQERIPVEIRTRKLPRTCDARPRVQLEVTQEGEALSVLPTLVYGDPPVARVDGGRLVALANAVPVRDELGEERLLRQLQSDLGLLPGRRERFRGEEAVAFARKLEAWKGRGSIAGDAHEKFFLAPALTPRLETRDSDFSLSFDSITDDGKRIGRADPSAVLRAWRAGASLVPLLDGGWAPLPGDWLARFGERIADLLAAKEGREELPASALPDLAKLCEELERPMPPRFSELRPLLEDFTGLPTAQLPSDLEVSLRAYQETGVRWLSFLKKARLGALLADDMGLGKTLQTLCVLEKPALVVAPTSVVHNWAAEAARFRPGLKVCLYHGPQRRLDPEADLTITSYALLRLDAEALQRARWAVMVLDE